LLRRPREGGPSKWCNGEEPRASCKTAQQPPHSTSRLRVEMELSTVMWRSLITASIFLPPTLHATAQERPAVSEQGKPLPQSRVRLPTNCGILTAMLKAQIDQMKELQKKVKREQAAPPPDLLSAWQRAFGKKDAGVAASKELKKHREHGDELNAALRSNGCPTIDINQELNITPGSGPGTKPPMKRPSNGSGNQTSSDISEIGREALLFLVCRSRAPQSSVPRSTA
jgi:hypothetical protein